MKEVKQKQVIKNIKERDTSRRMPKLMAETAMKIKEQTQNTEEQYNSPSDYAAQKTGSTVKTVGFEITQKGIQTFRDQKERDTVYQAGKQYAGKQAEKHYMEQATARSRETDVYHTSPKTTENSSEKFVRQKGGYTVKATKKELKPVTRTVKGRTHTIKTTETVSKETAKAAKTTARKAKEAAKRAAEETAKAVERAVKAAIEGIKKLIRLLISGGYIVLLVIAAIAAVAVIVCSAFGIFWSNETEERNPMTAIIQSIDFEYTNGIESEINRLSNGPYDEVRVIYEGDNDGDSAAVNNWDDVLGIFAVLQTTSETDATDVITVKPDTEEKLSAVFHVMNTVSFSTLVMEEEDETKPVPTPVPRLNPEDPIIIPPRETKTILTITVTQSSMTYQEAASYYGLNQYQMDILDELMSPDYFSYFADLIGCDIYDGADLTEVMSHLPSSRMGAQVVKAALTRLGAPYVMGAKGSTKFDCSGLVYWSIKQVDDSLGSRMYTNAAGQARYCYNNGYVVGRDELEPGDLVFWQNLRCKGCSRWKEVHHTGIYIGNGKVIEASSSKGRVVIRNLWSSKNYPIYMFGRPYGH